MVEKRKAMKTQIIPLIFSCFNDVREKEYFMKKIDAHEKGIELMRKKGGSFGFYMKNISSAAALIIKQEALSVGCDFAIPKDAIVEKTPQVDGLLLCDNRTLERLISHLEIQGWFAIPELLSELKRKIKKMKNQKFDLAGKLYNLSKDYLVMAVVNITPDSFYEGSRKNLDEALEWAESVKKFVDIFDVGGESTRPGANEVSEEEELARVLDVVKAFSDAGFKVSCDTRKWRVAEKCLDAGAVMINDVSGFRDENMIKVVADSGASACIMHMKGEPASMQENPEYDDCLAEVYGFLEDRYEALLEAGVDAQKITVDPGIGFGKRLSHNALLMNFVGSFASIAPVLMGVSRKSYIGMITGEKDPTKRLPGTISTLSLLYAKGARIFRVHDPVEAKQALEVAKAIVNWFDIED